MTSLLDAMTRRRFRPLINPAGDDRVVVFPSVGYLSRDCRNWIVNIHGDISCSGRMSLGQRVLLKIVKRAMRASDADLASPIFHERIDRFIAQARNGVRVAVRIGEDIFGLPTRTRRDGQFQAALRVPVSQAHRWVTREGCEAEHCLPVEVLGTRATGRVHLVEPTGLSVISDIDDTLKHTNVTCKRTLLTNTFLRPFETIPGMAPLFREWAAEGAAFHYVSSSPWQLYSHLADHLAGEGFPMGSFHLRPFRLRDHLLRRVLMLRRSGKLGVIRTLFRLFPRRRFLLVGDSGERDPEIYGALARRYPEQIAGIFIRQLENEAGALRRYARAFRLVDPTRLRIYRDAGELADVSLQA